MLHFITFAHYMKKKKEWSESMIVPLISVHTYLSVQAASKYLENSFVKWLIFTVAYGYLWRYSKTTEKINIINRTLTQWSMWHLYMALCNFSLDLQKYSSLQIQIFSSTIIKKTKIILNYLHFSCYSDFKFNKILLFFFYYLMNYLF